MKFSDEDNQRIKQAVKKAEASTSGEIVPLIVQASDPYPHADLAGGIVGQSLALIAGIWLVPDLDYVASILFLVGGFLIGYLATRFISPLKRAILGNRIVSTEVYQRALQAFFELGIMNTRDRTGILIMVSLLEHKVQVLADTGINEKVTEGTWDGVVTLVLNGIKSGSVINGLCDAIEKCGKILSNDFPIKDDDTNEIKNDLIVD